MVTTPSFGHFLDLDEVAANRAGLSSVNTYWKTSTRCCIDACRVRSSGFMLILLFAKLFAE
jgi:hypothetical protein